MHARRISGLHKRASVLPGMHSSRRDASVAEEEEIIKRPNPVTLPDSLETVEHWLVETDTNIAELIRNNVNEVEEYQALLAHICEPEPDGPDDAIIAEREQVRDLLEHALHGMIETTAGVILTDLLQPYSAIVFREAATLCRKQQLDDYVAYRDAVKKLAPTSAPTKHEIQVNFEQQRYENCYLELNKILGDIVASKHQIAKYKRIEQKVSQALSSLTNPFDDNDDLPEDLSGLFTELGDDRHVGKRKELENVQAEIKTLRAVLRGQVESVSTIIASHYPSPDQDWIRLGEGDSQSTKSRGRDFKIDPKLNITGPPNAAVAHKWMSYVSLYLLQEGMSVFTLLPVIFRVSRQKTLTSQHWQATPLSEWMKRDDDLTEEERAGFHESKLVHVREAFASQNMAMFIKAHTAHPDMVERATTGMIITAAGGADVESTVEENDFCSLFSYWVMYHMQQSRVGNHMLTQFFYHLWEAFKITDDVLAVCIRYKKRLADAKRVGVKISYEGVITPAYLELVDRTPSFIPILSQYRIMPKGTNPHDALSCVDPFLTQVERGARSIRDIPKPDYSKVSTKNAKTRYTAMVADLDSHLGGGADTSVAIAGTCPVVPCQALRCNENVSEEVLKKTRNYDKAVSGVELKYILCDKCCKKMNTDASIKLKNGKTRSASSKFGRKTLAQLGITIKKRKPKERGDDNESHLSGDKKGKKPTKAQLAARVKELEAAAAKAMVPMQASVAQLGSNGQFVSLATLKQLRERERAHREQ